MLSLKVLKNKRLPELKRQKHYLPLNSTVWKVTDPRRLDISYTSRKSKLKFRWHFSLNQNSESAIPAIDQYRCRYTSCSIDQKKKIHKKSKYNFKACSHTCSLQHSHKRDCHRNYSLDYCLERTVNKIKMCCDLKPCLMAKQIKSMAVLYNVDLLCVLGQ